MHNIDQCPAGDLCSPFSQAVSGRYAAEAILRACHLGNLLLEDPFPHLQTTEVYRVLTFDQTLARKLACYLASETSSICQSFGLADDTNKSLKGSFTVVRLQSWYFHWGLFPRHWTGMFIERCAH